MSQAQAAGLFLTPSGVRPLSRGGSFVAGADDAHALTYNPAGLSEAADGILLDVALPLHSTEYTRRVYADSPDMAAVNGQGLGLPIPAIGVAFGFAALPRLRFGAGIATDVPLLQNWPTQLDNGDPAPQRYAIENFDGTAISKLEIGASYAIGEHVAIGLAPKLLVGNFGARSTISNCDGALCTAAERADYDAEVQMLSKGIFAPGLQAGVIVKPLRWLRMGLSYELGYSIRNDVELNVRLPSASLYSDAQLSTDKPTGELHMRLPDALRVGVEARLRDLLRVEASFAYERWSVHDQITIEPKGVSIQGLPGPLNNYAMSGMAIERGFKDTWSLRLGGEGVIRAAWLPHPLTARLGAMYEPSAVPDASLTAMSVDLDKVLVAGGASYLITDAIAIEATYGHVFMMSRDIGSSEVTQTNPTRPAPAGVTPIGNGRYRSSAHVFGLGARYLL